MSCLDRCSLSLALALAVTLAAGCRAASSDAPQTASASDALLAADRAFDGATAARGAAGWGSFFAPDGIMVPPAGELPKGGPAEAEAAMRGLFVDRKSTLHWQPERAWIAASGDLGFTVGTYELHTAGADGQAIVQTGRYLTAWRKQADGSWKVAADIGNVARPAPTPSPAAKPGGR